MSYHSFTGRLFVFVDIRVLRGWVSGLVLGIVGSEEMDAPGVWLDVLA